jgi:hypothetical protein
MALIGKAISNDLAYPKINISSVTLAETMGIPFRAAMTWQ